MIAEQCKSLRMQLEAVAKAEEREKVVGQLESRRTELLALRESVFAATNSLKAISARTEIVGTLDPNKAIERVRNIREALRSDPLSITKGREFSNMKKAFEKFAQEGIAAAEATWEEYMPKARPSVDTNQLALAEELKDSAATGQRLRSRAKYADKIASKPPANEEELQELESTWEDIRQMIELLPPIASPPKVQEFLKAANSRNGAPINLLTDEVREWLHKNNIAEKYRITTM